MRTHKRYKFLLTGVLAENEILRQQVYPQYSSLIIKHTKTNDSVFYEPSFNSELIFIDTDFDIIYNADIKTKFTLYIIDSLSSQSNKTVTLMFMRTDCKIDANDKICSVTPHIFNEYKKLLEKSDDEYSVTSMGLDKHVTYFRVNPLREYYIWEDSKICVFDNSLLPVYALVKNSPIRWQDLTNVNPTSFTDNKDFCFKNMYVCGGIGTGVIAGRWSNWDNVFHTAGFNHILLLSRLYTPNAFSADGYYISLRWMQTSPLESIYWFIDLFSENNSDPLYSVSLQSDIDSVIGLRRTVTFGEYGTFTFQAFHVFSRCVVAVDTLQETDDIKLIDDDVDIYPLKYKFALREDSNFGVASESGSYNNFFAKFSTRISETDKGFGTIQEGADAGKFYDKPSDDAYWQPIYEESWFQGVSLWVYMRQITLSNSYYEIVQLPDSYFLGDVIKQLLNRIDSSVVFEPDTTHSQFLFGAVNPVTGQSQNKLYITQKSNFLNYNYDYAAWKAPIKWSHIVELLKNAFNCFFDLYFNAADNKWHLRIEHISFYLRGYTYSQNDIRLHVDLSDYIDTVNNKKLSFRTAKWTYDTESAADRYEFGWMDTQSNSFDGQPLIVPQEYKLYEDDKKEDRKISWFSADIDFMLMVPEECSNDGFMILRCDSTNTVEFDKLNEQRYAQNYSLAFDYLIQHFHTFNIYAERVKFENSDNTFNVSIRKFMRISSEIKFTLPYETRLKPSTIIITEAGEGVVETMELDLSDDNYTVTLKYALI